MVDEKLNNIIKGNSNTREMDANKTCNNRNR